MATRDDGSFAGRHDDQVKSLTTQISFLEEEVAVLRRRLTDSPRQSRLLEERLGEAEARLSTVNRQNERMADTLREARDQIVALKEEVDRLTKPPSGFGIFLNGCEDGAADVFTGGRKMRVNVSPAVDADELRPGQEVVLNESLTVVIAQGYETVGEIVMLKEVLEGGDRALVISHADEERVARLAEPLRDGHAARRRLAAARAQVRVRVRADPQGRGRGADPGGGSGHQLPRHRRPRGRRSSRSGTPSSCPTCTRTCSGNTSSARPRACCSTARPAAARRSSPRRWRTRWPSRSRPAPRSRAPSVRARASS